MIFHDWIIEQRPCICRVHNSRDSDQDGPSHQDPDPIKTHIIM